VFAHFQGAIRAFDSMAVMPYAPGAIPMVHAVPTNVFYIALSTSGGRCFEYVLEEKMGF
jgi:hypothetical protein